MMSNLTLSHTPAWLSGALRWFCNELIWKVLYFKKGISSWARVTSQWENKHGTQHH